MIQASSTLRKQTGRLSRSLKGTEPLGVSYESKTLTPQNVEAHNIMMSYGYVLALASRNEGRLKILDWGGGAGQYYLISKTLLPDVEIDYSCFDTPSLCELGRKVNPEVKFFEDPEALTGSYDLVLASSSLQYFENWSQVIRKLTSITGRFLYVTRLPVVERVASFAVVQRPYRYGYETEYLGWFLNRQSLLKEIETNGLELVREFLISGMPFVKGAPEQAQSRGFLFRSKRNQK